MSDILNQCLFFQIVDSDMYNFKNAVTRTHCLLISSVYSNMYSDLSDEIKLKALCSY